MRKGLVLIAAESLARRLSAAHSRANRRDFVPDQTDRRFIHEATRRRKEGRKEGRRDEESRSHRRTRTGDRGSSRSAEEARGIGLGDGEGPAGEARPGGCRRDIFI